jgi:hypothetical protein
VEATQVMRKRRIALWSCVSYLVVTCVYIVLVPVSVNVLVLRSNL